MAERKSRRLSNIEVMARKMRSDPLLKGLVTIWPLLEQSVRIEIADRANNSIVQRVVVSNAFVTAPS